MKKLSLSTQDKYAAIIKEAEEAGAHGESMLSWLQAKLQGGVTVGTSGPLKAAVKRYLRSMGYQEADIEAAMPKTRSIQGEPTEALTMDQLGVFHMSVEELVPEPSRTLLLLLPSTGLSIGEACRMKVSDLRGRTLLVHGNYKRQRVIELPAPAQKVLFRYIKEMSPSTWMFPNPKGAALSEYAVRKYTRKIADKYPDELGELSPHTLRVTAAKLLAEQGWEMGEIQRFLGHKSIKSTARYWEEL